MSTDWQTERAEHNARIDALIAELGLQMIADFVPASRAPKRDDKSMVPRALIRITVTAPDGARLHDRTGYLNAVMRAQDRRGQITRLIARIKRLWPDAGTWSIEPIYLDGRKPKCDGVIVTDTRGAS